MVERRHRCAAESSGLAARHRQHHRRSRGHAELLHGDHHLVHRLEPARWNWIVFGHVLSPLRIGEEMAVLGRPLRERRGRTVEDLLHVVGDQGRPVDRLGQQRPCRHRRIRRGSRWRRTALSPPPAAPPDTSGRRPRTAPIASTISVLVSASGPVSGTRLPTRSSVSSALTGNGRDVGVGDHRSGRRRVRSADHVAAPDLGCPHAREVGREHRGAQADPFQTGVDGELLDFLVPVAPDPRRLAGEVVVGVDGGQGDQTRHTGVARRRDRRGHRLPECARVEEHRMGAGQRREYGVE